MRPQVAKNKAVQPTSRAAGSSLIVVTRITTWTISG